MGEVGEKEMEKTEQKSSWNCITSDYPSSKVSLQDEDLLIFPKNLHLICATIQISVIITM